jgi:hypothetical protein
VYYYTPVKSNMPRVVSAVLSYLSVLCTSSFFLNFRTAKPSVDRVLKEGFLRRINAAVSSVFMFVYDVSIVN